MKPHVNVHLIWWHDSRMKPHVNVHLMWWHDSRMKPRVNVHLMWWHDSRMKPRVNVHFMWWHDSRMKPHVNVHLMWWHDSRMKPHVNVHLMWYTTAGWSHVSMSIWCDTWQPDEATCQCPFGWWHVAPSDASKLNYLELQHTGEKFRCGGHTALPYPTQQIKPMVTCYCWCPPHCDWPVEWAGSSSPVHCRCSSESCQISRPPGGQNRHFFIQILHRTKTRNSWKGFASADTLCQQCSPCFNTRKIHITSQVFIQSLSKPCRVVRSVCCRSLFHFAVY